MATIKNNKNIEKDLKIVDIKIAPFIAEYNVAINTSDHLVQLIKSLHLNIDNQKKMFCNKTKTTSLINNVIGETDLESIGS